MGFISILFLSQKKNRSHLQHITMKVVLIAVCLVAAISAFEYDVEDEFDMDDGSGVEPTKSPKHQCFKEYRECKQSAEGNWREIMQKKLICAKKLASCYKSVCLAACTRELRQCRYFSKQSGTGIKGFFKCGKDFAKCLWSEKCQSYSDENTYGCKPGTKCKTNVPECKLVNGDFVPPDADCPWCQCRIPQRMERYVWG